jgi:chemotaxis protein methyltransferase CheR
MLSDEKCLLICKWIEKRIGLSLSKEKKYLVEHRLEPISVMNGFESMDLLIDAVLAGRSTLLEQQVIDSLVTNETFFFRDPESYVELKEIVKQLYETKKDKTLRIWSAACSTGQELYSIAITLHDLNLDWSEWRLELIGTDISNAALAKAKSGTYNHFEVQRGLHITQLLKWFKQIDGNWKIAPPFQSNFHFYSLNLLNGTLNLDPIDLLFLRNVLIYFENSVKKDILRKMKKVLHPNGLILLGGTETAFYMNDELKRVKPYKTPIYQFSDTLPFLSDSVQFPKNQDNPPNTLGDLKWPTF